MPIRVVCALDPIWRGRELESRLESSRVTLAGSAQEIDRALRAESPDMVIAGTNLLVPPIERWIRKVSELPESPDVVLVHDDEDAQFRAAAIRAGCLAVLGSSLSIQDLAETIQTLIERRASRVRLFPYRSRPSERGLHDSVTRSPRMREFLGMAQKVVDAGTTLLLLGETGSGKEWLARALHEAGPRSEGPFVAVSCGALPESLVESELFGHEKDAFTGASRAHKGYFEQAEGGTLFLDEIGEIPPPIQVRLLRVLDTRQVQRLGAERSTPVNIRMVAATHRNLEREVEAGRFREDLFYRLSVVTLEIPPLRERAEDIPTLFASYSSFFSAALDRPITGIDRAALDALFRYRWPGNVRELINVVERAVLFAEGPEIGLADLPERIAALDPSAAPADELGSASLDLAPSPWLGKPLQEARQQVVDDFERCYLRNLLRETGGRIGETARQAGINERSLFELMRRHGLRKEEFRAGPSSGGVTRR